MSRTPTTIRFEQRPEIVTLSHAVAVCDMLAAETIPNSFIHHAFGVMVPDGVTVSPKVMCMKTFDSSYMRRQYHNYAYYERMLWFFHGKPLALVEVMHPAMQCPIISWACPDAREHALFWLAEEYGDAEPPVTHYGIERFPELNCAVMSTR